MTHALIPTLTAASSLPPLVLDASRVPFHADAILAAIDAHSEAWSAFQVALPGRAAIEADAALLDAVTILLATPCATRPGAFCLLRHLRWFLAEEASNADVHGEGWRIAQAREAADSDGSRPPIPTRSRPAFRFDVGHHSEMKPATR